MTLPSVPVEDRSVAVVEVSGQPVGIVTATDLIGLLADAS